METQNNKVKLISSILDEINDALLSNDQKLEILEKEKDYLNNIVSMNKFDMDKLEREKADLRRELKTLQDNEYVRQKELQDTKIKLFELEKNSQYAKNSEEIRDLELKLEQSDKLIRKFSLQVEELTGLSKLDKMQIENLEKSKVSTHEYLQNHVKKENYKELTQEYEKSKKNENAMYIMVQELYMEVSKYESNHQDLSFEQYISNIKMRFKQLENDIEFSNIDKRRDQESYTHDNFLNQASTELSEEEKRLKRNLGL